MTLASCVCTPIDHGSQSERRTVFCLFVYVFVFVIIKKVFSPTSASKFPQIFLVFQGYNFDTSGLRMLQYHQHSSVTPEAVFIGSLISWGSFEQIKTGTYFGNSKKKKTPDPYLDNHHSNQCNFHYDSWFSSGSFRFKGRARHCGSKCTTSLYAKCVNWQTLFFYHVVLLKSQFPSFEKKTVCQRMNRIWK